MDSLHLHCFGEQKAHRAAPCGHNPSITQVRFILKAAQPLERHGLLKSVHDSLTMARNVAWIARQHSSLFNQRPPSGTEIQTEIDGFVHALKKTHLSF